MFSMRVRGVLFADYVRMIRRALPGWREVLDPADLPLVDARVEPDQWYPMDTFGRLGLVILEHVVGRERDAVRLWGRTQVQTLLGFFPDLAVQGDPEQTLLRFQATFSNLFDFPALALEEVDDAHARLRLNYGLPPAAEEAATWQTLGFIEELLTASAAREVTTELVTARWVGAPDSHAELRWAARGRTPRPTLARPRVLLIDDEPLVARGLRRLLHKAMDLTIALRPSEALELLAQQPFDAVLCDFHLPERDGLALCAEIARRWPNVKRVLHSGALPPTARKAKADGVIHEYLDKPASRDVLVAVLSAPVSS
ncbi:MAG: DUF2378 family protein [Myxococcota bacterium]